MSYIHPFYGLNITPWNPALALGVVCWMRVGRRIALPWFAALVLAEGIIRDLPSSLPLTFLLASVLLLGYGVMAHALQRHATSELLQDHSHLLVWLRIVVGSTLVTSVAHISALYWTGLIPADDWLIAIIRFWIGDCVGIVATMPFFWLLFERKRNLQKLLLDKETIGYGVLAAGVIWISFAVSDAGDFKYFYLLFPPIVWAAARQGIAGAAIAAFLLQGGIILAVQWQEMRAMTVFEVQLLVAVLVFVGLFIGVIVDEKQRMDSQLRHTLQLVAAGEMAAALAHELNQPITAISAYGSVCDRLFEKNSANSELRDIIGRMVTESKRAADVVRRLRDFFLTGTTHLESVEVEPLIQAVCSRFTAEAVNLRISLTIAPLPHCTLLADRLQLEVVLRNLLANAFEAVSERPPEERSIEIRVVLLDKERITIRFQDSGPGLSSVAMERIFKIFQSSKANGLGLGLAMSRAIAEAHGGTLHAESGECGVFVLTLPVEGVHRDGVDRICRVYRGRRSVGS
ncbi:MAG: MASE1 domain-containing protein [Magnetococcales bacterium]|nr:MASE1 domain-containing protein [Magnetococcales bacterium]